MGKCPKDGGDLVIRQSRFGKRFLGCSNYPSCTVTYPLPQMGHIVYTGETCKFCNSPLLAVTRNKSRWVFCPKIDCEFNKKKRGKSEKAVS
jgi:DNA topoisomerase-1